MIWKLRSVWLKKSGKSKIHFNLQCFDSSSQSTYIEGNILQGLNKWEISLSL